MSRDPYTNDQQLFVGNTNRHGDRLEWLHARGVSSARFETVAYDIDGKALPEAFAPILIDRAEAEKYNDVMMTATFGPNWRRA